MLLYKYIHVGGALVELYKYPRTYHFPFSEGATSDDKILKDTTIFDGKQIVITEKMDGENTSIYNGYFHARSLDSKHQVYHSWLAQFVSGMSYNIPNGYRICGEYLYAKHSIGYDNLKSYFYGFSVWKGTKCLSWKDTMEWFEMLDIVSVPVLYEGIFNEDVVKQIAKETVARGGEGIVVRLADSFIYEDFSSSVAKFVRKNHVQTDKHWSTSEIKKNNLE